MEEVRSPQTAKRTSGNMPEVLFRYEVEPINGQVAAVHRMDQSVAVGACLGAQHENRPDQIVRFAPAADSDSIQDFLIPLGILLQG